MGCRDWLEEQTHYRAEWRSVLTMPGELSVTTVLEYLKHRWSVRNWNSAELVSYMNVHSELYIDEWTLQVGQDIY